MHWNELGRRVAARTSALLTWLFGSRAGDAFGILVYHSVAPRTPGVSQSRFNVTPARFRQQLAGLLERGFTFRPLSRVLDSRREGAAIPRRTVVVTFDDGFETVYTNAWPVLRELGVPATLFLSTAYLDCDGPFPFDHWGTAHRDRVAAESYHPLRTDQCRRLLAGGLVELASHGHTHADFRGRPDAFREDLRVSMRILKSNFGIDEAPFAFPHGRRHLGYVSDELVAAARQAGVICALTTECVLVDPAGDPFTWGRFNAYDHDTGATLAARLHGWYGWAPGLQAWLSKMTRRARSTTRNRPEQDQPAANSVP